MENTITPHPKDKVISGLPNNSEHFSNAQFEKEVYEKLEHHIKENIDVFIRLRDK